MREKKGDRDILGVSMSGEERKIFIFPPPPFPLPPPRPSYLGCLARDLGSFHWGAGEHL
jgi:hypothetical protein